ncbi:phosphohydrolase [Deinococcus psychrotolerans]|uniref:Phosphohydrolase n=1 Tax=Deinococcus psychrotolerans TaxID=2489213 RepID=A0A3G8YBC6_9DEIO|nr:phosphohydrolase [Deinococcus psychrotolerans]AZI42689.1 phosphohydrolase [Deinococcus psychrotolerans]
MAAVRAFCTPFYAEPHRAYHNLRHVEAMLSALEERRALTPVLELAIWGHDLIYDPARNDNESRSAEVFGAWLAKQGEPDALQREIGVLILATRHDQPPSSVAAALLVDADLAIFGASDAEFWAYERAIRQEYAFVPWPAYRAGRQAVLQHFLGQERIYSTPEFADLEAAARAHLNAASQKLADSPEE